MPTRAPRCAWIAACALALPTVAAAQAARSDDVVELIVREGPRAVAIRAELDIVQREQAARRVWPNPAVAYSREGAGFTEFLQAEQALPILGVRTALGRAGIAAVAAAEAERDARLWALRAEASTTVARLAAAQARVTATAAVAERVDALIGALRVRETEGEGSRFDRLRAEIELAGVRRDVADARADLAAARGDLAALLPAGAVVPAALPPAAPERPLPADAELASRAAASRAELRASQQAVVRGREEASVAVRQRLPQPTIIAGVKRADDGGARQTGGLFGVGVTVPVFDTGRHEAARWQAERRRADAQRVAIEQQIRAEVAAAAEIVRLRGAALRSAPPTTSVDELLTMAELAYREGEIEIVALLDAFRAAGDARVRDIDMRLDARLAHIELERAVGGVLWP
jgi:outer membrane protein, heavy metal efflux system